MERDPDRTANFIIWLVILFAVAYMVGQIIRAAVR